MSDSSGKGKAIEAPQGCARVGNIHRNGRVRRVRRIRRLARGPVVLLPVLIAYLAVDGSETVFGNNDFLLAANILFTTLVPLTVAIVAARIALSGTAPGVLSLGAGMLAFGTGSLFAGLGGKLGVEVNVIVTVYNVGVLLLALSSTLCLFRMQHREPEANAASIRRIDILLFYGGILTAMFSTTFLALGGLTPTFFDQAGATPLRQIVLLLAIVLLFSSSIQAWSMFRRRGSAFVFWFSLALALIATGIVGIFFISAFGSDLNWTGRIAQYLGSVYLLAAIFSARRDARKYGLSPEDAIARLFSDPDAGYRLLVENSPDIIARFDRSGRYLFICPSIERLTGLGQECFLGRTIHEVGFDETNVGIFGSAIDRAFETGEMTTADVEYATAKGKRIYHSRFMPEQDNQGRVVSVLGVGRDLTEMKRAEEEIRESELRFRQLFDNAPLAYQSLDEGGYILDVNNRWLEILGYSKSEVIGRWFGDVLGPVSRELFDSRFPLFKHDCIIDGVEFEMLTKDGRTILAAFNGRVQTDRSGNFQSTHCIFADMTAHKRDEEALRESEERYRALINASSQAIYRMNPDWSEMRQLQGGSFLADTEQPNRDWVQEYIHPDDQQRVLEAIATAVRSGTVFELEHRIKRGNGTTGWTFSRAVPVRNAAGEIVEWFGAASDITERKRAEEELRSLTNELEQRVNERTIEVEQANRAKDVFLANMSHEIRTPLAGVFGLTELLLHEERSNPVREDLEMIRSSAASVLYLLNDLLDLSRIERGKVELSSKPFRLREMLEGLVNPYAMQAVGRGIAFHWSVAAEVPEQVLCDPDRLSQVLKNLLFNALKFTEAGSIHLHVRNEERSEQPDLLRFSVSDTGIGIPGEKVSEIFQPFMQVDPSYSKRFAGAGLGLAISKQLIELMGGEITVESQLGRGSTFTFTVAFEKTEPKPLESSLPLTLSDIPPLSVLLAEDNPVNRLFMKRALTSAGHRVEEAENGLEALEMIDRKRFDLVLMDIQMPVMDGVKATRQIRSKGPGKTQIPIIALTAYAMKGDREKFLASGMDGYVTKPVDFGELAQTIAAVCRISYDRTQ
jgi:two-component system, sensor histidine kinase and response regulator